MATNASAKLKGWKSRRVAYLKFYRCPGCGRPQEMIGYGADKMSDCYTCAKRYHKDRFGTARVKRYIAECGECGSDVSLTSQNFAIGGIGWVCAKCSNYVAVVYGAQMVNPRIALHPRWNPTIRNRGEEVGRNTVLVRCKSKKDLLVVQLLQVGVKEEDSRFLFCRGGEQKAGIYFDTARREYLGFIVWTESAEYAVLRQIFIVPGERRKGLGESMVRFWVSRYAERLNEKFGIEAPNEKAIALHLKLGHVVKDGESLRGVKCFCVPTM